MSLVSVPTFKYPKRQAGGVRPPGIAVTKATVAGIAIAAAASHGVPAVENVC